MANAEAEEKDPRAPQGQINRKFSCAAAGISTTAPQFMRSSIVSMPTGHSAL
jgi:hypothetical protein